ncbi:hypothetical protein HYS94_02195 [Candidatus Daviesbacteria bacterium]|nr:hypothetical protein [Candidatus Daviesbacteria bacterium]
MPLTLTERRRGILGDIRYATYDVAFDTLYAAGGEPLTAANVQMESILLLKADAPAGYIIAYDYTNATLRAYRINVVAGTGTQGVDVDLMKSGTSTLEVTGDGTAFQVALGEVTTNADMSTDLASVRVLVFGNS